MHHASTTNILFQISTFPHLDSEHSYIINIHTHVDIFLFHLIYPPQGFQDSIISIDGIFHDSTGPSIDSLGIVDEMMLALATGTSETMQ